MKTFFKQLLKNPAAVIYFAAAFLLFTQETAACEWDYPIWQVRSKNADPLYRFVKNGKVGYIDQTGKIVVKPTLDLYGNYGGEFFNGLLKNSFGDGTYIDRNGKISLDTKLDNSADFSEGLAAARKDENGKWGYISETGEFAISPRFEDYLNSFDRRFSDDLAMIKVEDKFGYIDRTGGFIIEPKFLKGRAFQEGLAVVIVEGPCMRYAFDEPCGSSEILGGKTEGQVSACKYSFVDKTGLTISAARFDQAKDFSEGLAAVQKGDKWGYIDKQGRMIIEPQFDEAESFSDGLARIQQNDLYGFIDRNGTIVIAPKFKRAENFVNGLAPVGKQNKNRRDGEFYFINKSGQQAFPGKFALASNFFKGLAHVKLIPAGKIKDDEDEEKATFGYINTSGKKVFIYERNFAEED